MSAPSAPPDEGDNIIRSPDLPFVSSIVGGLFAGRAIVISGMVLPGFASDRKRFDIDLCCGLLIDGDHMDNKALHFNPRFEAKAGWFSGPGDDKLVMNSFVSGRWGNEERFDNPFKEGEPFMIRIMVLEKYFKIAAGGKHVCDFPHRVPVDTIRTISIKGNIRVDYVEFQPPIGIGADGKPTLVAPTPRQDVITQIEKPPVPFVLPLPIGGFVAPQSARFTITPFLSAACFTINLMAKEEFFFHFRVDMPNHAQKTKPAIVRNSTKNMKWQTEERTFAKFPFSKGITHDVVFTAYGKSVTVDVDGAPFVKFVYRDGDDPVNIDAITVRGDVLVHRFVHKG
uniref:Galectin n=1 Tax=Caenorhabditis tropicalis TaxID=1561998 RepID=A0A1I7UB89_9PELO